MTINTKGHYSVKVDVLRNTKHLVEEEHYSKSVNGVKVSFVFSLWFKEELIGCVLYGQMATTAWKKFGQKESDVLELRRLVIKRGYDKNINSWFVSKTIKFLKKHTETKIIVSYADPYYSHRGYIYQALNFIYIGLSGTDKGYRDLDTGKTYHSRALRTKYKGRYKPFVEELRKKLEAGTIKLALLSQCTHPTTVKKSHHYPGGYFDTAETKYWDECTICGTKLHYTSKRGVYG